MRLATWNVNSLPARMPRVEEWLGYARPDVLCLQETKQADGAFPGAEFARMGYESVHHGDGRWNGVAILSRVGLDAPVRGLEGEEAQGPRFVAADCGGVRVASVYVPNGRSLDSEHYPAKLAWMASLRSRLAATSSPDDPVAVCGDFNIAPDDRDVWSPAAFKGATHVSAPERAALADLEVWGLVDAFRTVYSDDGLFSWWDYRAGSFHKGQGLRIDLLMVTRVLAEATRWALIDRNARKGEKPSDHTPVFIDIDR